MSNSAVIQRTFSVLEAVAASGSASAKAVASRLEIPLPTVYRLLNEQKMTVVMVSVKEETVVRERPELARELGHL